MTDSTREPAEHAVLDPRATTEAVLFEIRRVIVGQDEMLGASSSGA